MPVYRVYLGQGRALLEQGGGESITGLRVLYAAATCVTQEISRIAASATGAWGHSTLRHAVFVTPADIGTVADSLRKLRDQFADHGVKLELQVAPYGDSAEEANTLQSAWATLQDRPERLLTPPSDVRAVLGPSLLKACESYGLQPQIQQQLADWGPLPGETNGPSSRSLEDLLGPGHLSWLRCDVVAMRQYVLGRDDTEEAIRSRCQFAHQWFAKRAPVLVREELAHKRGAFVMMSNSDDLAMIGTHTSLKAIAELLCNDWLKSTNAELRWSIVEARSGESLSSLRQRANEKLGRSAARGH